MICDSIDNFIEKVPKYVPRCAELKELLEAVRDNGFDELKKMDFARFDLHFDEYETKPCEKIPFEAHRKYWDLQLVLEGEENVGYAPLETLTEKVPYSEDEDIAYYSGDGQEIKLSHGMALLLAPWDGHRPGAMTDKGTTKVKKIVVKLLW